MFINADFDRTSRYPESNRKDRAKTHRYRPSGLLFCFSMEDILVSTARSKLIVRYFVCETLKSLSARLRFASVGRAADSSASAIDFAIRASSRAFFSSSSMYSPSELELSSADLASASSVADRTCSGKE